MKLATLKTAERDGELVVVDRGLSRYCSAKSRCAELGLPATMQSLLDHWSCIAPKLSDIYQQLNDNHTFGAKFAPHQCHAPLPRAYQWADGSAYVNHVQLVRKGRGAEMPASFWHDPLMYQGGSDRFIGPYEDIECLDEEWGIDFEAEIAIVTGDVPMGANYQQAQDAIRLVMLVNDVSLRNLIPAELAKGFGFFQSKPASAFSPVAVTLDELAEHWRENKLHLPLLSTYNQQRFGEPNAGQDMTFDFAQLVMHASKTRALSAGTIIGSGTVSNKQGSEFGSAISEGGVGYSCIAERRMIETINHGRPITPFMRFGDLIRIEMNGPDGKSIFGAIEQRVTRYEAKLDR